MVDADQDWEVRDIIGKKDLDVEAYYLVDWRLRLVSERSQGSAKELLERVRGTTPKTTQNRRPGFGARRAGEGSS